MIIGIGFSFHFGHNYVLLPTYGQNEI